MTVIEKYSTAVSTSEISMTTSTASHNDNWGGRFQMEGLVVAMATETIHSNRLSRIRTLFSVHSMLTQLSLMMVISQSYIRTNTSMEPGDTQTLTFNGRLYELWESSC